MTDSDKLRGEGTIDQVKGKAKDVAGSATGDSSTEAEGKLDQLVGKAKEGVANIKDKLDGDSDKQ